MSCPPGGVADSVSKWVFRQRLPPEQLKAFLQAPGDPEEEEREETGAVSEEQRESPAYGTAGQNTRPSSPVVRL